jgi:hypothetical protein
VALNGAVFDRPLPPVDFQGLARSVLLREGSVTLQTLVDLLTPYFHISLTLVRG